MNISDNFSSYRIHLLGSKGDKNHPDSRAIIFEEVQYSRKNITDFVATLDGFELSYKIIHEINHYSLRLVLNYLCQYELVYSRSASVFLSLLAKDPFSKSMLIDKFT